MIGVGVRLYKSMIAIIDVLYFFFLYLAVLGQRYRGSVPLPCLSGGLCGNMVVAVVNTSPRMAWILLARPTIDDAMHLESIVSHVGMVSGPWPREARREWPIALAREVVA